MSVQESVHELFLLMKVSGFSVCFEETTLLYSDPGDSYKL